MDVEQSVHVQCGEWQAELNGLYAQLPAVPRRDMSGFVRAAAATSARLPGPLLERLRKLREGTDGRGYLHLTALPVDPGALPATPQSTPAPVDRPLLAMEGWLALIGARLGLPTAYREHRAGSLMQDIYPALGAHPLSAESSTVPLILHTEMAYHLWRPDFVLLACSRADHDGAAATTVAAARAALPLLTAEERGRLRRRVPCATDLAFRHADGSSPLARVQIIDGPPDDPSVSFDEDLMEPPDAGSRDALHALSRALNDVAESVPLRPGDLLVLDNNRVVHGRTAFAPRWDGQDRWLHRLFVTSARRGAGATAGLPYEVVPFAPC